MENLSLFIPDFLKIQRESFRLFLKKGLICELNRRNPIVKTHLGSSLLELRFYSEYYRLTPPPWTVQQAILKKKNYASQVYVPIQFINHNKKKMYLKWILLATLPLMTKRGHFIINGSARIIINQITRGPGIYFHQTIKSPYKIKEKKIVYADIIPLRGTWLRLEIDKKRRVWAKMKATPPIPALVFIQALNIEISTILQTLGGPDWFKIRKEENSAEVEEREQAEALDLDDSAAYDRYMEYLYDENLNEVAEERERAESFGQFSKSVHYGEHLYDERDVSHFIFSKNTNIACQTLAKYAYPKIKKEELSPQIGKNLLERKFLNSRIYDLGILGRLNLNKRFHKAILTNNYRSRAMHLRGKNGLIFQKNQRTGDIHQLPLNNWTPKALNTVDLIADWSTEPAKNQTTLTGQDVLFAFNELIKIYDGNKIVDDIDDLKNRRLRTAGELIQTQFATGLIRLEKFITEQISQNCFVETKTVEGLSSEGARPCNSPKPSENKAHSSINKPSYLKVCNTTIKINKIIIPRLEKLFNIKPINSALQEFFNLNPLSQFMDQTNPLAEITHKRRLTSLGPGGVNRETAGMAIRGIHPTHYGRICPIETPEGQNAGLVNSITTQGYVDSFGYLKTPFYKIYKGQVQRELGPLFLSSEQEKRFSVVPGDIFLSSIDILPGSSSVSRFSKPLPQLSSEILRPSLFGPKAQRLTNWKDTCLKEKSSTKPTSGLCNNSLEVSNYKIKNSSTLSSYTYTYTSNSNSIKSNSIKSAQLTDTNKKSLKQIFNTGLPDHQKQQIKYQIPIRHYHEFKRVFRETVNYMIISPIQMISIATSLIPFLEHDDANRALMGSNMQRQAVPLLYATRPIVGTGLESRSMSDSGQAALSSVSGLISYSSSKKIVIYTIGRVEGLNRR